MQSRNLLGLKNYNESGDSKLQNEAIQGRDGRHIVNTEGKWSVLSARGRQNICRAFTLSVGFGVNYLHRCTSI